jgi:ankyrin repeat protein
VPSNPIKIKEILIQGKKGQTSHAIGVMDSTGYERPILFDSGVKDPLRVDKVSELILRIAFQSSMSKEEGSITRAITDEFSFYPENTPFTLEEYKQIISQTVIIAKDLEPDIHLLLATFPVVWPDGGIHNCGLYVESPKNADEAPIIHHFSKKYHSPIDFNYASADGDLYRLTTDKDCTEEQLPDTLLKGSGIATHDPHQFGSALKLSPSVGGPFILTIGVCVDHSFGVERAEVHGLIEKLNQAGEDLPLYCSHVITSASALESSANTLSTVSHADPVEFYRRPKKYPNRWGFEADEIKSEFSGILTLETFPEKRIGTLHSDLFKHIAANQSPEKFAAYLNEQDIDGKTPLHHVFSETDFDSELIAKRIYSMILNGANPDIVDKHGVSVRGLAIDADHMTDADGVVFKALESALVWKEHMTTQNMIAAKDNRTLLTRMLLGGRPDLERIKTLILGGANPYIRDGHGQSAIDIVRAYSTPSTRIIVESEICRALHDSQYSYMNNTSDPPSGQQEALDKADEDTLYAPIKNAMTFHAIMRLITPMERRIIYEDVKHQLPQLIKTIDDFRLISPYLNHKQQALLFDTVKTILVESVQSVQDCLNLLVSLTLDQHSFVFETIKTRLPSLIGSIYDLNLVLRFISPQQKKDLYSVCLPGCIHSVLDFQKVLEGAQPENYTLIYECMKAELPTLIDSIPDFISVIKYLPVEQSEELYDRLLPGPIQSAADFREMMQYIPPNKHSLFFKKMETRLPELIHSIHDLRDIMSQLGAYQLDIVCQSILGDKIQSADDFYVVLKHLNLGQRGLVLQYMIKQLPYLIKSVDDFHDLLQYFTTEDRSVIFNAMEKKFFTLTPSDKPIDTILEYLTDEQKDTIIDSMAMGTEITNTYKIALPKERGDIQFEDEDQSVIEPPKK